MTHLVFTTGAVRDYKKLPTQVRARVNAMFDGEFRRNPLSPELNVTKLKPPLHGYRIRVGDYRILFEYSLETITIYRIRNRNDAYR